VLWPQRITPQNYQNVYRRSLHLNTSTTNLNLRSTTVSSTQTIPLFLQNWEGGASAGLESGGQKENQRTKNPQINRRNNTETTGARNKIRANRQSAHPRPDSRARVSTPSSQYDSHTRTGASRQGKSAVGFATKDQTRTIQWNAWGGRVTVRTTASTPGVVKFLTSRNPFSIVSKLAHECLRV
jgi:hypothetical protein